jgi:methylmalonyl-CoA mutase cobalamin-binding subunit
MMDGTSKHDRAQTALDQRGDVEELAARAISVLASQSAASTAANSDLRHQALSDLCDAFVSVESEDRHKALARLLDRGVTADQLISVIIPETARLMGDRWFANRLSFAEVTIGAARLQETVRSIALRRGVLEYPSDGPSILMIVPRSEHHTLGVFVAAEQMRRVGLQVRIAVGMHDIEIAQLVRKHRFPMIGISASNRRTLPAVRDMITTIKAAVPQITPVVVGGGVTTLGVDVKAITRADFVSSDIDETLAFLGVEAKSPVDNLSEPPKYNTNPRDIG